MDIFSLSANDVSLLRRMIADWKGQRGNTEGRTPEEGNDPPSPRTYLVLTPEGGIPALEWDRPGSADCRAYQLVNGVLRGIGLAVRVYNLSETAIPEDTWALATKDKFGVWWTTGALGVEEEEEEESGTGTGSGTGSGTGTDDDLGGNFGSCALANLKGTDCVLARSGSQEVTLYYNQDRMWDSIDPYTLSVGLIDYPAGAGMVELWYEAGRLHLAVDGLELLDCGDGCFTGGPLTGHTIGDYPSDDAGTGSGSGSADSETGTGSGTGTSGFVETSNCDGETFTVCLRCGVCPPEDTGTGSGTGTAVDPPAGIVETVCCPDRLLPENLYYTISNKVGTCVCLPDSGTLTYDAGDTRWEGANFSCLMMQCEENATPIFKCVGSNWDWNNGSTPTSSTCNPFSVTFNKTILGGSYTVTITE